MQQIYGVQAKLEPDYPFLELGEVVRTGGAIAVSIDHGTVKAEFTKPDEIDAAKELIKTCLDVWSLRHRLHITANFYHTWQPSSTGHTAHSVEITDTARIISGLTTTHTISHGTDTLIRRESSAYSFEHVGDVLAKSLVDPPLAQALHYMNEEVFDNSKPLYGVYKAIEELSRGLSPRNGHEKLAALVGEPAKYVKDITQTAQPTRHAKTAATEVLSEQGCIERTLRLIEAYSHNIPQAVL